MSRAMTVEEMRSQFFATVATQFKYWRDLKNPSMSDLSVTETHARMEGFLFSLFNILDGNTLSTPAIDLIPSPHDEDEAYCKSVGEDWWTKEVINDTQLHEIFPWETLK